VGPALSKTVFRGNERRNTAPGMRNRVAWLNIPEDNFLHIQHLTASELTKQANYRGKFKQGRRHFLRREGM
jgi:hypothetical protein